MTLNIDKPPTGLILLFAAMMLIFALSSCEKSELPENDRTEIVQSEKGKPPLCGAVITPDMPAGEININYLDFFNMDLYCGTLPVPAENSVQVSLKYDETYKVTYNYTALCSEIELIATFENRKGNITYPSDQRIRVWDLNGNEIGYSLCCPSIIARLVPGTLYKIGFAVSACNLNRCNTNLVHFKVECL